MTYTRVADVLVQAGLVKAAAEPGAPSGTLKQRLERSPAFKCDGRHVRWVHYRSRFFTVSCGVSSAVISGHNRGDDEQYDAELATLTEAQACLVLPLLERLDRVLLSLERKLGSDNQVNEEIRNKAESLVRNVFKGSQVGISETHQGVLRLEVSK